MEKMKTITTGGNKALNLSMAAVSALSVLFIITNYLFPLQGSHILNTYYHELPKCPHLGKQPPPNYNTYALLLETIINDEVFRNQSVVKMQRAVQHDTTSYDNEPINVGDNLSEFTRFELWHDFLNRTFPIFHNLTTLHKVNHFGLVYIWQGSDTSLKPLLLMAHQDTTPVDPSSLDQWIYPPFDGHYDGKYLHGRGSADCKDLLIGQIEAAEELMKTGFSPKRTIIFSYGFDEEITGVRNHNAKFIEDIYGPKSLYAVMDEGGVSLMDIAGSTMAVVGTGEKGYFDLAISIDKKGGHSSVPPDHTAIGIIGDLIVQIENNKFPTYFVQSNPTFFQYVCLAENSIDLDPQLKHDILYSQIDDEANKNVRSFINRDRLTSYAIKTTQALDIIHGGVKVNALPEYVELNINARVTLEEDISLVFEKFLNDVEVIAKKYNLGLTIFYPYSNHTEVELYPPTENGVLSIWPINVLEPSPITPVGDRRWEIFAGTLRHVYENLAYPDKYKDNMVVVSPGLGTGNTDTKLYWNLTDHIYRYRPGVLPSVTANSHGINEYIEFDGHLQIIAFTIEYILSVDEEQD
ncbi:hypothetical protein CANINC_002435 [Pichia inconspicua]|uniref:Peptidase M20 dimerisation domain-containing protein n=1 Tax=Pichia inconspicua TaxID=52247 RepID=A0A4T0X1A1_9ASCO|nr:hypothetical protein CANINC_002435 [[Candida] inconspicua]